MKTIKNMILTARKSDTTNKAGIQYWIDKFLEHEKNTPLNSQMARKYDLAILREYTEKHQISTLGRISEEDLKSLFETLLKNKSLSTVRRVYSMIKQFFAFLVSKEVLGCASNPFSNVNLATFQMKTLRSAPKVIVTPEEDARSYQQLIENAQTLLNGESHRHRYRDYAILMLILNTSLNPEQIVNLRKDQLHIDGSSDEGVIMNISEGHKTTLHDVELSKDVINALRLYFEKSPMTGGEYLIQTDRGHKLHRTAIWQIVNHIYTLVPGNGKSRNPNQHLGTRSLRRMFIRNLQSMGLSSSDIARKLNCNDMRCVQGI